YVLAADAEKSSKAKGEVLDMACFMAHKASGSKHAECGSMCLTQGMPAGLLKANGSVVLLIPNHENPAAANQFDAVSKLAGEQATVTGKMSPRGGITAIVVESITKG